MTWQQLRVAADRTHHLGPDGEPTYAARFDDVLSFHAPGLAAVAKDGAAWHIDADGAPAYERRFRRSFGFYDGLAAVTGDEGWHHVTPTGADAYAARHAWCGNFQEKRCPVRGSDGQYHHINRRGAPAYTGRWSYAGDYRHGIAVVQSSDGRSTHIDSHGKPLHHRWFLDLDVFHKGFARARDDDGWMHVDHHGRASYSRRFAAVEPFYNGQARAECFDGALDVIDERGLTLQQLRPALRSELAALSGDMVGFWRSQTIAAAVQLGVIEELPAGSASVAARTGLTPEGAARLLRALGELRLVERVDDIHRLTGRGALLRREHPLTLADAALEYAGAFTDMWRELPAALSASSTWVPPDVFADVANDPTRCMGHHRMLRSYARHDYPAIVDAMKLHNANDVIDAGGGLGALAAMIRAQHPGMSITVLDRPEVVNIGREHTEGLTWHPGDFLEPWGLEADVVVLARVLHDWPDERATTILKRAREALRPGGRVLIVEMLLREGGVAGAQCDLHLLVATGGQERTLADYERLLHKAGLIPAGARSVSALPSIITGRAP